MSIVRNTGPAIVQLNGVSYYFKTGLKIQVKRNNVNIDVDAFGTIAKAQSGTVVTLTGTPAGAIRAADLAATFPYTPRMIGSSVFGSTDAPLIVQTITDGQQITWSRGAITKHPGILLSATKGTLYKGDMTFTCLMASTFTPTSTTAFKSIATAAFTDTTFDPQTVRMAQYIATWGTSSPYNSMFAQDGFDITFDLKTDNIEVDGLGVIDMTIKSMEGMVKFKPASLTEAQIDTLVDLQGTGGLVPGAVLADSGHNLVIASSLLTVTMIQTGATDYDLLYQSGKLRAGEVAFVNSLTFTTGVPNPIFTFAIP
jgi:hypothetical protein